MVSDLSIGGFWQKGPNFLLKDYSEWPIKHDFKTEGLEGKLLPKVHVALFTDGGDCGFFDQLV